MHKRSVISFLIILGLLGGLMLRIYYLSGQQFSQAAERQAGLTVTVANIREPFTTAIFARSSTPVQSFVPLQPQVRRRLPPFRMS